MAGGGTAAALLVLSAAYLAVALTFPLGTAARPGPGFYPAGVGVFLCLVAVALGVAARRRPVAGPPRAAATDSAPRARQRVAIATGGLVGFCLALPWIGYPATAALFLAALLRGLGGGPVGAAAGAVAGAALSHYVFAVLLDVPLPRGLFLD
jgi:hypothetical protein